MLLALLGIGLLAGFWIRHWTLPIGVLLVGLAFSVTGWLTGWTADQDSTALGGAILLLMFLWLPLGSAAAIGVGLGQAARQRRQR